jgi:hypothetical protein
MKKEIGVPNRKFLGGPLIFWFTNKKTVLQNNVPNRPIVFWSSMMKLREKERDDLWVIREREEERKRGKKDLGGGGCHGVGEEEREK